MQTSFFNTTSQRGSELLNSQAKATNQNEIILQIFKEYPTIKLTPFDVQYNVKRIYGKDYPITSVRRSLTTLTDKGDLIKSDKATAKGIYRVANHSWKLNTNSVC